MTALSPILEAFFTDRLARQRQASPHIVAAYRDDWRLLLAFTHDRIGTAPCRFEERNPQPGDPKPSSSQQQTIS